MGSLQDRCFKMEKGLLRWLGRAVRSLAFPFVFLCSLAGCSSQPAPQAQSSIPRHILTADATWQINLPNFERFDASGLAFTSTGALLTINDRGPEIYRIALGTNSSADLKLLGIFSRAELYRLPEAGNIRFDTEGVAVDSD